MAKHMQQTLPANLQYYQKSGGYVPPHVQQQMAQHMQSTMPEHLKQYISPYMQQQVVPQHLNSMPGGPATTFTPHTVPTQAPDLRFSHTFDPNQTHQPDQTPPPAPSTQPIVSPEAAVAPAEPYAFITDPQNVAKRPSVLSVIIGKSLLTRVAILSGGFIGLLIVLSILRGLLAGSFNVQPFLSVLQDQQELIHLTASSNQTEAAQLALPAVYQNLIATTQLAVSSNQTELITYLVHNKQKISPQDLNVKVSTAVDTQLTAAATSNTYAATLQTVMSSKLTTYMNDLRYAYTNTSGKLGRAQLNSDYKQASLLMRQLNQLSNTTT
jgi:hypothetical protein